MVTDVTVHLPYCRQSCTTVAFYLTCPRPIPTRTPPIVAHGSTSSRQCKQEKLYSPPAAVAVVRATSCLYWAACCSCYCKPQHASLLLQLMAPAATVQPLLLAAIPLVAADVAREDTLAAFHAEFNTYQMNLPVYDSWLYGEGHG